MVQTPIIFYSTDYLAAEQKAKEFAASLLGRLPHPDFLELPVEGKMYTKEVITLFLSDMLLAPYEAKCRVTFFPIADKMLPVHANALLKAFEEKPDHAALLLATDNIKGVLETILSRSQKIFVPASKESGGAEKFAAALEKVSKRDLYGALDLLKEMEEIAIESAVETFLRHHKGAEAFAIAERALLAAERYTKPKLILEYLLLNLIINT